MDRIAAFYTRKSEWFGPSGVLDHHRARAADFERLCGPAPKRVLELGAGAGGTAAALAERGHHVVAVELSPLRAAYARDLAREPRTGSVTVVEGDFYSADLSGPFDVMCYWDGFGVGSDADQRRLLRRVGGWLADDGSMLLDVFNPFAWARVAGREERVEGVSAVQRRAFDPVGGRFIDEWRPVGDPTPPIFQSIRCYAPADLLLLLEGTGLALRRLEVDGEPVDAEASGERLDGPFGAAWSYRA